MALAEDIFFKEEQAFLRFWQQAEKKLKRIIFSLKTTDFSKQRTRVLLSQVQAIIKDLQKDTDSWLDRNLPRAFKAGFNWTGSGFAPGDFGVFASIPKGAVDAIILAIATDTREALYSIDANLGTIFTYSQQAITNETQLMELIGQNIIEGKGPQALARDIVRTLRDGAVKRLEGAATGSITPAFEEELQQTAEGRFISIRGKDGKIRRYQLKHYSEMVARSATRMAQTEGTLQSCQQLHIDLVQISVHANACLPICAPIQGKIYSVSGTNPDFPPLSDVGRAPYHPHCRHVLLPAPEEFLHRRGIYRTLSDFSNSGEQVPDAFAYRDLLAGAAA